MGRWNTYLEGERLDEKVSKKEIDTALRNNNILVGCEFEWKVDDGFAASNSYTIDLYERAVDEVDNYNREVTVYENDYQEYMEETESLKRKIEIAQDSIDELEQAISDQNEHNDELDTYIEEAESDKDDLENELSDTDDEATIKSLKSRISTHKVDILRWTRQREDNDKTEERWRDEIWDLESEKSSDEEDVKYREDEGVYEQIETPYVSRESMPNYFEYMGEYAGMSERELYAEPGEEIESPPDYDDGYGGGVDDFEQAVHDSGILNDAPFNDYNIGDYGDSRQKYGDKDWAIEPDSSLGDDGIEVKNPPFELPGFIKKDLPDMLDWIDRHGYTDGDCGFHVHMSLKKTPPGQELDFLKLILFTDEQWIYSAFEERAYSHFASSVQNKIKSQTTLSKNDINALFTRKKLVMKLSTMNTNHYDAINNIDPSTGHVEFRYMGGTTYHRKEKDIIATIGVYAHNLSLAMDPEYKRREYILKLQRIFNKMEMFYREKKIQAIRVIMSNIRTKGGFLEKPDTKILDKKLKEELAKHKILASVYKLDGKTKGQLKNNRRFMMGVASEVAKTLKGGLTEFSISALADETNSWF